MVFTYSFSLKEFFNWKISFLKTNKEIQFVLSFYLCLYSFNMIPWKQVHIYMYLLFNSNIVSCLTKFLPENWNKCINIFSALY